jgi:sulfatase modifying factor 1
MKRFFPMILTFMLILTLAIAGCGGGNSGGNPGGNNPGGGNPGGDNPGGTTYTPGQSVAYTVGSDTSTVSFNMHYAPSGSFPSDDDIICGCGLPSTGVVSNPYWIAETDVTYQLWNAVYTWATTTATDKYIFANADTRRNTVGNDLLPVDWVSWREAMVWCNALTECYNAKNGTSYACVYYMADHSNPIRSVNDDAISPTTQEDGHEDNPYVDPTAKGFRLPTSNEWELAARYQDGKNWTPGDHISGDTSGYCYKNTPPVSSTASTVFQNYACNSRRGLD